MELPSSSWFHLGICDYSPPLQRAMVPSTSLKGGAPVGLGPAQSFGELRAVDSHHVTKVCHIPAYVRGLGELLPSTLI